MKIHNENLNIQQIAESGQCFRMNPIAENLYSLIAFDRYIEFKQIEENLIEINCSEDDYVRLWKEYLDIDYDYGSIVDSLKEGSDEFLKEAASFGSGIRILRQEPFEMLISFIISQNKNIPSIKACIERICEVYGNKQVDDISGNVYYTFPSPEKLANAKKEDLRALKLGYRDEYIIGASKRIVNGELDFEYLKNCSHEETVEILKSIRGIGDKVANCISLFGLHHVEAFPIDIWMKRVLTDVYDNQFDPGRYHGHAGIVQQYMFYYIRHINGVKN